MSSVLEVDLAQPFGNELIYPVNETARIFARISGRKTLILEVLQLAIQLGYKVKVINADVGTKVLAMRIKAMRRA